LSPAVSSWDSAVAWRAFRFEAEAVRNYPLAMPGPSPQPPITLLEINLPTLLHIKALAIFDDILTDWLVANGHRPDRKQYRDDLNGRLCYVADRALYADVATLHDIRRRRNGFAHTAGENCGWATFDGDVAALEMCLVAFNLAKPTGTLKVTMERGQATGSTTAGLIAERKYRFYVTENGREVLEQTWIEKFWASE
jgi:hypothetical protein